MPILVRSEATSMGDEVLWWPAVAVEDGDAFFGPGERSCLLQVRRAERVDLGRFLEAGHGWRQDLVCWFAVVAAAVQDVLPVDREVHRLSEMSVGEQRSSRVEDEVEQLDVGMHEQLGCAELVSDVKCSQHGRVERPDVVVSDPFAISSVLSVGLVPSARLISRCRDRVPP